MVGMNTESAVAVLSIVVGAIIIIKPDLLSLLVGLFLVISGIVKIIKK